MEIKVFSEDVANILSARSKSQCIKYYHTLCKSGHIFLSTFGFLATNKEGERYKIAYSSLKTILNKYGVDGKTFEAKFLQYFPKGEEPSIGEKFVVRTKNDEDDEHSEYNEICENLKRKALKEKRTMEVEDLVLELFSDTAYTIFMVFTDIIGLESKVEEMYDEIRKKFRKATQKEIKELEELSELTNLNKWVSKNPQKVINAEEDVMKIEMALSGRSVKNCVLTGPAGTGKTTYVYAFVQDIVNGVAPEQFLDKVVYELHPAELMSGTKFRGQLEEKLTNILNVVKDNPNVILFIDEIHTLVGMNEGSEGGDSILNMLKPYMTRGEIQVIGATTAEEYAKYLMKDKAICGRFHEIKIKEPDRETTKQILEGLLPVETEFFKKDIQEALVEKVLDLAEKYALEYANPRKSINMLELACAYSRVFETEHKEVNPDDVINSVKLRYNIYISENKIADVKNGFKELLGQDDALNQIVRNLEIVDAELIDPHRPALSMLLCGPSGTGKTRAAEIIAKNFFGSEENVVKINMG